MTHKYPYIYFFIPTYVAIQNYQSLFGWLAASQPAALFSHIKSASATCHLPANSIFLSQQISTGHQPAEQGRFYVRQVIGSSF
jgi:hypothetical protein